MTIQLSTAVRNAKLDAIETTVGVSAIIRILSGTMPSQTTVSDAGTVLATFQLPSDWMANAASGQKAKAGTWEDTSADASGSATYFRLYNSSAGTCHMQGSAGDVGGEDLVLDNASINTGQQVTITGFTWTEGNA